MIFANNKIQIEKCIVSFSHNKYDSRKLADNLSIEKAKGEIKAGKNGISHLILRSRDDDIDRLKFLFFGHIVLPFAGLETRHHANPEPFLAIEVDLECHQAFVRSFQ